MWMAVNLSDERSESEHTLKQNAIDTWAASLNNDAEAAKSIRQAIKHLKPLQRLFFMHDLLEDMLKDPSFITEKNHEKRFMLCKSVLNLFGQMLKEADITINRIINKKPELMSNTVYILTPLFSAHTRFTLELDSLQKNFAEKAEDSRQAK